MGPAEDGGGHGRGQLGRLVDDYLRLPLSGQVENGVEHRWRRDRPKTSGNVDENRIRIDQSSLTRAYVRAALVCSLAARGRTRMHNGHLYGTVLHHHADVGKQDV
ncbi:MAG: hypothetical protein M3186_13315 [Actinomycetota bacterium]|nr:hypothetical protein [Actinomycetota bacterium]